MALNSEAKIGNLKRSIDLYVKTNLESTERLAVDYEGVPFDNTVSPNWIQPRIVGTASTFYPAGKIGSAGTSYAEQVEVLLQVNVFTKKSGLTCAAAHWDTRDAVAGYFRIGQDINLYEATGTTVLSSLRVREIVNDFSGPETTELYQYVYGVMISQTRLTNKG